MSSIKDMMSETYKVDQEKIDKMASVDIANGGTLPLPEKGESVNIKFTRPPVHVSGEKLPNAEGAFSARCVIFGQDDGLQYDVWLSSTIYKGILAELQKNKIEIDDEMKCIVGRVFSVSGKEWKDAPKEMWKMGEISGKLEAPKTYGISLRVDLEAREANAPVGEVNPGGTTPDLFTF